MQMFKKKLQIIHHLQYLHPSLARKIFLLSLPLTGSVVLCSLRTPRGRDRRTITLRPSTVSSEWRLGSSCAARQSSAASLVYTIEDFIITVTKKFYFFNRDNYTLFLTQIMKFETNMSTSFNYIQVTTFFSLKFRNLTYNLWKNAKEKLQKITNLELHKRTTTSKKNSKK